jgi:hypothetical protein
MTRARMFMTWHIFFAQPELYPNMIINSIHEISIASMQTLHIFGCLTFLSM